MRYSTKCSAKRWPTTVAPLPIFNKALAEKASDGDAAINETDFARIMRATPEAFPETIGNIAAQYDTHALHVLDFGTVDMHGEAIIALDCLLDAYASKRANSKLLHHCSALNSGWETVKDTISEVYYNSPAKNPEDEEPEEGRIDPREAIQRRTAERLAQLRGTAVGIDPGVTIRAKSGLNRVEEAVQGIRKELATATPEKHYAEMGDDLRNYALELCDVLEATTARMKRDLGVKTGISGPKGGGKA